MPFGEERVADQSARSGLRSDPYAQRESAHVPALSSDGFDLPMTRTLFALLVGVSGLLSTRSVTAQRPVRSDACIACHAGLAEPRLADPVRAFENDVHAGEGFGCLACHGGATAGRDASRGFLSKPARQEIPQLCGRCHSDAAFMRQYNPSLRVDQVIEYATSVHGQRLRSSNDPNVATCVDCHPAHGTRPPSDLASTVHPLNVARTCAQCHADDDRMAAYAIPTDQQEQHRNSVHGKLLYDDGDVSAPTCNDCHGNHGASPPGLASIRNVCGECHATMADYYAGSGHIEIFDGAGLPGCETCHGNHAIEPTSDENLELKSTEVCARCHQAGDSVGEEFAVMKQLIDSLKSELDRSRAVLASAANAGMEVSQAEFELEDVNNALTLARNAIHSFHVEPVRERVDEGFTLTTTGLSRGLAALGEHRFRRVGLGVSTLIILGLIAGILLRIRQMEAGARHKAGSDVHGRTGGPDV
jgi:predicted CXXCH cytochrome family protein